MVFPTQVFVRSSVSSTGRKTVAFLNLSEVSGEKSEKAGLHLVSLVVGLVD